MANAYTDTTVWANLVANAYDKFVRYQLRSRPVWRQFVDVHPVAPTIEDAPSVTLNIMQEFAALATTPLSEDVDPDAVAPPAPLQVTVSVAEYGNADLTTLKLRNTSYTQIDPIKANLLGKNMIDTLDKLVQNVADTGTHIVGYNGASNSAATLKSDANGYSENAVQPANTIDSMLIRSAGTLLQRRNVMPQDDADNFVALAHPDVMNDILGDTGWLNPHQYVDPTSIYNREVGTYLGFRWLQTPRITKVTNTFTTPTPVYRTYLLAKEALVEAQILDGHMVVGPQVDKLRRFFPLGWYAHLGFAVFRQEAILQIRSASSVSAL